MATPNVFQEGQERNKQDVNVAVASAEAPAYTEEKSVPLSVTLGGALRVGGTGATDLGKAEDAAHTSGDTGVMALAVRYDDAISSVFPAALTGTSLDYSPIAVDSAGRPLTRLAVIGSAVVAVDNGASSTGTLRVAVASDSKGANNPKSNATIISTTSAVAIGTAAANAIRLHAIHIYPALTGTCVVAGFSDGSGAQSYTFPAASTGTFQFWGAVNSAGACTVTCSNAADDNKVMILWSEN
jgi:hypothetical protein